MLFATNDEKLVGRWQQAAGQVDIDHQSDFAAVRQTIKAELPALVLLDLNLPGADDLTLVMKLCRDNTGVPMILLAETPDEKEGLQLVSAGARGYCNRYIDPELLEKAIEVVNLGEVWLGRKLITRLMENLAALTQQTGQPANNTRLDTLTAREKEIALLVGEGASNKQIARTLDISERTVKAHLGSVFSKTETKDRLQLGLLINISRH